MYSHWVLVLFVCSVFFRGGGISTWLQIGSTPLGPQKILVESTFKRKTILIREAGKMPLSEFLPRFKGAKLLGWVVFFAKSPQNYNCKFSKIFFWKAINIIPKFHPVGIRQKWPGQKSPNQIYCLVVVHFVCLLLLWTYFLSKCNPRCKGKNGCISIFSA